MNHSVLQKYTEKEDNQVENKIEELKIEICNLAEIYTEKDQEPTDEEKRSLFQHLDEIKAMIQE